MKVKVTLVEEFDVAAARTLLGSSALPGDVRKELCKWAGAGIARGTPEIGRVTVDYVLPSGTTVGRFVARPGGGVRVSLTSMPGDVRAWCAGGLYHDVDMANCQPTLSVRLFEGHGIACPAIKAYVEKRDSILGQVTLISLPSRVKLRPPPSRKTGCE